MNDPEDVAAYVLESFGREMQAEQLASPANTFLVAEVADGIAEAADGAPRPLAVGYARLAENPAPGVVPGERPLELVRLYAEASWVGRGVGSALMQRALQIAAERGFDVLWLSTWDRNERGTAFYRRWGFEVVGEQNFVVGTDVQHDWLLARAVTT